MVKFLYFPLRYLIVSVFSTVLFFLFLRLINSNSMIVYEQLFFSLCMGTIILTNYLIAYIKLIISFKRANQNINLNTLSFENFKTVLVKHHNELINERAG